MKFQVNDGEKYQKIMEVEVPVAELELPIKLACKRLAEKVNIPGFRKGKVPRSILESHVGMEAILQEACDDILPKAYTDGLKETGLKPCAQPEADIVKLEVGEPIVVKFIITVQPEFELGEYKGVKVTRRIIEMEDEDVDMELQARRERMAKAEDAPEDYAAANGDTAIINFRGIKDGEAFQGGTAEAYPLQLGSGTFIPGFEEQVVGMKVGEEKNVEVTFPEEYQEKSLAGQPVIFEVKVTGIKQRVLPELDQAFVEECSETAENMEQLRAEIKESLNKQSMAMADENTRNSAIIEVVDHTEIDLPPVMVEQELDAVMNDLAQRLNAQGLTMEKYLEFTNSTMEDTRESAREQAIFTVKRDLILEAIATKEDFEITEEEINEELQALAQRYWQPVEKVREALEKNNSMDNLKYGIRMQKAANIIYDNAVITDEIIDRAQFMAETIGEVVEADEKEAE